MSKSLDFGRLGESLACDYLKNNGFNIIKQNFYCRYGEIDIIAVRNGYLHFIEIKSRHYSSNLINPLFSVDFSKQDKIKKTALFFLSELADDEFIGYSFDVITVVFLRGEYKINFVENAF